MRTRQPGLHIARSGAVLIANISFFTGLSVLPLAEAVAISFATPLIVTLLSVIVLREHVGVWRWGAIVVGLIGVLVVIRPGAESFQIAAILPLIGACGYAVSHILTRQAGRQDATPALSLYPTLGFILISAMAGIWFGDGRFDGGSSATAGFILRAWIWPTEQEWVLLMLTGVAGSLGAYLVNFAYKTTEAGLVASFEYIGLPLATLWGVLVFCEWPELPVWVGSILIISAGLASVWRESLHARQPTRPRPRSI